jgi:uncharacterized protein
MMQTTRPRIRRRWIVLAVLVVVLLVSIGSLVNFYTDLLWFDEVGFVSVFWTILATRIGVGVVAGVAAALVVLANLEVARRWAPTHRFVAPGADLAEQYRTAFRPYARLANLGAAAIVGLFTGLSSSAAWQTYLLWRNARPFGVAAPEPFGQDVSYFVFSIPFQRAVLGWGFGVLIVSMFFAGAAHLLNGSIQPEQNRIHIATVVKVHLSVLLGLIALLKAWAYRLDQHELVYSPRGTVVGASYTDVHAQIPALRLLMVIAVVAAVILFANAVMGRFRGWLLPGAALGLWAFSSILLGAIVPAAVQRFTVTPNESERERPYIQRNIEATRSAFGLDRIQLQEFPAREALTEEVIEANRPTIDNIRLWDPRVLEPTFRRLQAIRTYYEFQDVDIDRYMIDGQLTQVMLSAREVDPTQLAPGAQNWVNQRLIYTHGFGMVAVPAKSVTPEGLPEFLARDVPPRAPPELEIEVPGLYYGERPHGYAIVNTRQEELHYPAGEGESDVVTTHYDGEGGVRLTNLMRRAAFALRFSDTDLLISGFIHGDSRVMFHRNITERARAAAPFLHYDGDPYLVVIDGRLQWIIDAYTTTDRYPYSERMNLAQVGPHLGGAANYMRNSVKVVVDAYDGTMNFYIVEPDDALATTYQAAFPDLFTPLEEMPEGLRAHLRYPEDFFKTQAMMYRDYHILDARRLYEREDIWDIPVDPARSTAQRRVAMDPYYVVMKLPGEAEEEFVLMLPFTPRDRPILNGWIAARMDPGRYGEVIGFSFPRGVSIEGPENISARIEQNDAISRQFTLWEGAGSRVIRGHMLVVPIGSSLIYEQPVYLEAAEAALPELRRVIVVVGDQIGFESTLEASLDSAMAGVGPALVDPLEEVTPADPEEPVAPAPVTGTVAELLQQALDHFQRADSALRNGDLATYQRENEAGRRSVEEAQRQASS